MGKGAFHRAFDRKEGRGKRQCPTIPFSSWICIVPKVFFLSFLGLLGGFGGGRMNARGREQGIFAYSPYHEANFAFLLKGALLLVHLTDVIGRRETLFFHREHRGL